MSGRFLISLDFELYWGIRDHRSVNTYGENLRGVHQALPRMLELFEESEINATFATVGFLFLENSESALAQAPAIRPTYSKAALDPYPELDEMTCYRVGPEYFAPELMRTILDCNRHEVATHTYSHYYCLEEGQTIEQFHADLSAAIAVAKARGIELRSIVLPRNQINVEYLSICKDLGLTGYRGNEFSKLYAAIPGSKVTLPVRILKFLDCYVNLTGQHCYSDSQMRENGIVNLAASRFLRPYYAPLASFESLKIHRILVAMRHAAKNNLTYHLWWHPHNFGVNLNQNISNLRKILNHYRNLKVQYGMRSCTLAQASKEISLG